MLNSGAVFALLFWRRRSVLHLPGGNVDYQLA
jgi:hypothetical protein